MHTKTVVMMLCFVPMMIFSMGDEHKKVVGQCDVDHQLILDTFYKSRQRVLNQKRNSVHKIRFNQCSGDTQEAIARRIGIAPSSYAHNAFDWRAKL